MTNTELELICETPSTAGTYTYAFYCDTTSLTGGFTSSNTHKVDADTCSYTCKAKLNNGKEAVSQAHEVTVQGECV